jgi:hypothetical protein
MTLFKLIIPSYMDNGNNFSPFLNYYFGLIMLVISISFKELYPFTVNPMFSDKIDTLVIYEIKDCNGKNIDPKIVRLDQVYDGNPVGLGAGFPPTSTNLPGRILDSKELNSIIKYSAETNKNFQFPIEVNQLIFGPCRNSSRYGLQEIKTFLISI